MMKLIPIRPHKDRVTFLLIVISFIAHTHFIFGQTVKPVAHYPFGVLAVPRKVTNGGDIVIPSAYDVSGNGKHGTFYYAGTANDYQGFTDYAEFPLGSPVRYGEENAAMMKNNKLFGSSGTSYLAIPNPLKSLNEWTVTCFIKTNSMQNSNFNEIFDFGGLRFGFQNGKTKVISSTYNVPGENILEGDTWYFIVFDEESLTVYDTDLEQMDNKLLDLSIDESSLDNTAEILNGDEEIAIKDLRIHDQYLTEDQIESIINDQGETNRGIDEYIRDSEDTWVPAKALTVSFYVNTDNSYSDAEITAKDLMSQEIFSLDLAGDETSEYNFILNLKGNRNGANYNWSLPLYAPATLKGKEGLHHIVLVADSTSTTVYVGDPSVDITTECKDKTKHTREWMECLANSYYTYEYFPILNIDDITDIFTSSDVIFNLKRYNWAFNSDEVKVLHQGLAAPISSGTTLDAFMFIGQSNMAGRADIEEEDLGETSNTYLLNSDAVLEPARNTMAIVLSNEEVVNAGYNRYSNIKKASKSQLLGPVTEFGNKLESSRGDKPVGLIVNAKGGTSADDWDQDVNSIYQSTIDRKDALLTNYSEAQIKAVFIDLGETDRANQTDTEAFKTSLTSLISNLRDDLNQEKLPVYFTELPTANSDNEPYNTVLKEVADNDDNVHFVGCKNCQLRNYPDGNPDPNHYDSKAERKLGKNMAVAYMNTGQKNKPVNIVPIVVPIVTVGVIVAIGVYEYKTGTISNWVSYKKAQWDKYSNPGDSGSQLEMANGKSPIKSQNDNINGDQDLINRRISGVAGCDNDNIDPIN